MSKKSVLGIDIGFSNLKLAQVKDNVVEKIVIVPMPERMLKEGHIVSPKTMSDLIKEAMKENGLKASGAALALSDDVAYVRNVKLPWMSTDQLNINLPYEFKDFLTEDLSSYVFDYAMRSTPEDYKAYQDAAANGQNPPAGTEEMDLMGAVVSKDILEEARDMLKKAGLDMVMATPYIAAYTKLLQRIPENQNKDYCIVDLGHTNIRVHFFKGDRYITTRNLDSGVSRLEDIVASELQCDIHLARLYLKNNHENCQFNEKVKAVAADISNEILRATNFYRFSNPDTDLKDIWLVGGGENLRVLKETMAITIEMIIHSPVQLVSGLQVNKGEDIADAVQAVGAAISVEK